LERLQRDELTGWQLAERLGVSDRTISDTLSRLSRDGLIEEVDFDGAGKQWRATNERREF